MSLIAMVAAGLQAGGSVSLPATILIENIRVTPNDASATFTLEADGDYSRTTPSGTTALGEWHPSGGAAYEARATLVSGTLTSGTTGSWLALSSDRSWNCAYSSDSPGAQTATLTIEIRRASDSTVLATSTVTINAQVEV